jgi:hypothetical protein
MYDERFAAFFDVALRQAKSVRDAFVVARALVQKRELREHFEPSSPQMAGGGSDLERPAGFAAEAIGLPKPRPY